MLLPAAGVIMPSVLLPEVAVPAAVTRNAAASGGDGSRKVGRIIRPPIPPHGRRCH